MPPACYDAVAYYWVSAVVFDGIDRLERRAGDSAMIPGPIFRSDPALAHLVSEGGNIADH